MNKVNEKNVVSQQIIAGILKNDANIEFFGIKETKTVKWLQHGKTHDFSELSGAAANAVIEAYEADAGAKAYLKSIKDEQGRSLNYARRVELYIYYCYGAINETPDMVDNILQAPENFRHSTEYVRSYFDVKKLQINGKELKLRELQMIDLFAEDHTDYAIAKMLGIALPTLNDQKRVLFKKARVQTKTALMIQAERNQLTVY